MRPLAPAVVPLCCAILAFTGCADLPKPPAGASAQRTPFTALPGWATAPLAPGLRAFIAGCERIAANSALRRTCEAARAIPADDEAAARRFAEENFDAWALAAADGSVEGMVTGYYEPVLSGSRARSERFRHPVYGVPADLVAVELEGVQPELKGLRLRGRLEGRRLVPYWTRAEIESRGALAAPVLAWVEDPVELFFLQIQGSGQIALEDGGKRGERLRLGYADQNGHPYRAIGRVLVEQRELTLEQASMQGIKAWAAANPHKLRAVLDANPSYVFFREAPADAGTGPIGTLGAPLTAGYSLAVDPRHVPLGAPVFLATTWPGSTPGSSQRLERLMAAQDTGGAIRGAVRADFFWGSGEEAGALAGRMRQRGRLWILWPRNETLPKPQP